MWYDCNVERCGKGLPSLRQGLFIVLATRETGSGSLLGGSVRGRFPVSPGKEVSFMHELPYFVECLMALAKELPSFVDLIIRHIVEILNAM